MAQDGKEGGGARSGAKLIIRPAEVGDVAPFMADVRPIDRQECITGSGVPLGVSLREITKRREATLIALPDRTPLVLWGVGAVKDYPCVGAIWLVATEAAVRHAVALHHVLRGALSSALDVHPVLWNVVWEKNEMHVKWLRRMGAEFIAHHPMYGKLNEPFLEFIITRDNLTSLSRGGS